MNRKISKSETRHILRTKLEPNKNKDNQQWGKVTSQTNFDVVFVVAYNWTSDNLILNHGWWSIDVQMHFVQQSLRWHPNVHFVSSFRKPGQTCFSVTCLWLGRNCFSRLNGPHGISVNKQAEMSWIWDQFESRWRRWWCLVTETLVL